VHKSGRKTSIINQSIRGLVGRALDHRLLPPSSNLGVGISKACFIFDFASLPLEVARPILPTVCTKVAIKHQSSSSSSFIKNNVVVETSGTDPPRANLFCAVATFLLLFV